jgi:hypothetical protein
MRFIYTIQKGIKLLVPILTLTTIAAYAGVIKGSNKDSLIQKLKTSEKIIQVYNEGINGDFTNDFFTTYGISPDEEAKKRKAKAALEEVEASNNFVDYLKPSDISKLPVGLTKSVGSGKVTIAITKAIFTPRYAELTVFAKITIPQSPGVLFFGIQGLKLSNNGGIIGDAKLVLLGDVAIPINGKNAALILKGGFDSTTGNVTSRTYISIDCSGFKELGISADVSFPRSLLQPIDLATGKVKETGNVTGSFTTIVSNWNDILASFSLPKFQIKGLNDFNFTVSQAIFDFSDYRNSSDIIYPAGYEAKYVSNVDPESWRGVYIKNLNIELPKAFTKKNSNARISFGVSDMIIDNNGLTGIFYAENLLPINEGSASGWQFSVDSLRIAIEANRITRAGFGGKIVTPVAKNTPLGYGAVITASSDYIITVTNKDTLSFDMWMAKAYIDPNSYVKLSSINGQFRPEAMLHGRMGIYIDRNDVSDTLGTNKKIAEFNGIKFTALLIKTESPKLSVQYFGYEGLVKIANFPISIQTITVTTPAVDEIALKFTVNLNLHEGKIGASTTLSVISNWNNSSGISSLSYKKIEIDSIALNADIGGMKIIGKAQFMRKHPVYGDGFKGNVIATFINSKFKVDVTAIFGSKDFRYWLVDGLLTGLKIPIFPPVNLTGFGGGAFYRMKKTTTSSATTSTGYDYVPDSTAGLGVRAAVEFNTVKDQVMNGGASFEMAFNNNGGLRYVGFYGYAKVAAKLPSYGVSTANYLSTKFNDIEAKLSDAIGPLGDTANIIRKKMFQPTAAARDIYPTSNTPGIEGLEAYLGIQYNFETSTLDANFDLYVNAAKGLIKGTASGNRAGWARLYIAPDKWYLHMGKPTDRIGLRVGIGGIAVQTDGYFMIGHDIPSMPPPPAIVSSILNSYNANYYNVKNRTGDIALGKGFAFGTSVSITTGDINLAIFYARIDAGAGFDIFVRDLSDYHCQGDSDPVGINGWYLDGQAYAYFQGEVGIRVKLLFIKKNIPILRLGAAALIEAHMPNPTWFQGQVGGYYSILGGLISGNCNFSFRIGSPCQMVAYDPAKEYENMATIDHISPDSSSNNVSTLVIPEITFKMPIDETLDADLDGQSKYRVMIDKLSIIKITDNLEVEGTTVVASQKYSANFVPSSRLEALTDYKFKASLYYQEYKNNTWVSIFKDGVKLVENREVAFKTAQQPDTIDRANISYTWPVINQRNFYKQESNVGYIKLSYAQPYLFETFNNYYAEFKDEYDNKLFRPIVFNNADNRINYEIPSELVNGRSYTFTIKGRNVGFTDTAAGLNKKFLDQNGEVVQDPKYLEILKEEEIKDEVDAAIRELLQKRSLTTAAIDYFLKLDEMRRVAFMTAAGFGYDEIDVYIHIRAEVILKMLTNKGYGISQVSQYMEEMYKTIEAKETIAQMTISEETQKPLITFNFRVSDYSTFASKINSLQTVQSIIGRESTDVINLQAKINTYEGFDAFELNSLPLTNGSVTDNGSLLKLIECEATLDDIYYLSYIKNLIYKDANTGTSNGTFIRGGNGASTGAGPTTVLRSTDGIEFGIVNRMTTLFGLIPSKAVMLSDYYYNQVSSVSTNNYINQRFPFIYSLPGVYNKDFLEVRSKVINYYINQNLSIPSEFNSLVNDPFPFMGNGSYKALLKFKLPDNTYGTQGTFIYQNDIQ